MSQKKLFLLDGHALVYRAHFAFIARPLINSKGQNTSAITGFVRTLWDLLQNEKPTHIAVIFDPHGPVFRHEMYPEYKANREEQPEDIRFAFPYIREIVHAMHIPVMSVDNYEADDLIGTLAKKAEKEGFQVYMVTPDKDYAQLVSDNIFIYKPSRQGNGVEILGPKEVIENWEIDEVLQVIDHLAMQGDAVDNIPGIPGIGKKTASKLIKQFGSVENLIASSDQLKGKQKENVENFAEQAILSKKLATIDLDVPTEFKERDFLIDPFDKEKLSAIFKELEFRSLAKQILGEADEELQAGQQTSLFGEPAKLKSAPAPGNLIPSHSVAEKDATNTVHNYQLVDSPAKIQKLAADLAKQKAFCFDTETTGIDANEAELVGIAFSWKSGEAYYVPVPADQVKAQEVVEIFRAVLENSAIGKIAQNFKYDALIMKWYGVELKGPVFDTMIAHYLLEPELRHNMDYLAETYLKYQPISIKTLIGKGGKNQLTMRDIPVEKVTEYAAEDADITLQLKEYLEPKLQEEKLEELYRTMEEPLIHTLVELEYNGIRLDADYLEKYSVELGKEIQDLERQILKEAGVRFNIASPKQVGEVLFERLKIPYRWTKTKSGQYSTNEEKLAELAGEHPIIDAILKHRGLTKLKSTYVDALPRMVNPKTGRVHSSFNQALASTGRLSSNNPNLQNIPVRTPEGAKVREAFIPRNEDCVLLAADYSQIELRIIAEISGDEAMLKAFQEGKDIHRATAAGVFSVPFDEVTREQRYRAKTVNFSIIYGAGSTNLSRQLGIPRAEAKELIDNYFAQYPGLRNYMERIVDEARENGYVYTLLGRRRYLRDIDSKNGMMRSQAERLAINSPIQGTAADMIKMAMIRIHEKLKAGNFKSKMILQVHDELVFDAYRSELDRLKPMIEEEMKNAIPNLKVPILVEMGEGNNWLEAH
ncbi:MAG: DNA polymerase I [Saprospiraceae bacterium]|nr:DNA polymerase I [Saprospiraceae bacterium]